MTTATREQAMIALFNLLASSSTYNYTSRRFQTWDQINSCLKPAMLMIEHKETHIKQKLITPAVRMLNVDVYLFIADGQDQNKYPIIALNNLIDAIDPSSGGVLAPNGGQSQQTLGGLVTNVYIDGDIIKVPGDIDGLGVAIIPLKVVFM